MKQGGRDGRPAGLLPDTPHRFLIGAHSGQQLLLPGNYQPAPRDTHKGLKIGVELTVGENYEGRAMKGRLVRVKKRRNIDEMGIS